MSPKASQGQTTVMSVGKPEIDGGQAHRCVSFKTLKQYLQATETSLFTCAETLHPRDVVSEAFLARFRSLALEGASGPLLELWWSFLLNGCWVVHFCHLLK